MNTLRFLLLSILAISVFIIYLITTTTNPLTINTHVKELFFVAVFSAVSSLYAFIALILTRYSILSFRQASPLISVRQGVILGAVTVLLLGLQSMRILSALDIIFTISAAVLFEMFFRVRIPVSNND